MGSRKKEGGEGASGWIPIGAGWTGNQAVCFSHSCSVPVPSERAAGSTTGPIVDRIAERAGDVSRGE